MIYIPRKSLMAALMCLLPGAVLLWGGIGYGVGGLDDPGPGLFPAVIGCGLLLIGAALGISRAGRDDAALHFHPRPFLVYPLALACFALALHRFGILPAVALATMVATFAKSDWTPGSTIGLGLAMMAISYVVFIWMLGLPVPAFLWRP